MRCLHIQALSAQNINTLRHKNKWDGSFSHKEQSIIKAYLFWRFAILDRIDNRIDRANFGKS